MEGKLLMGPYLIWVILLLGQLHGYKSCIVKERKALLELKKYMVSKSYNADQVLTTWTNDTNSDCCRWDGIECNLTSGRVIGLSVGDTYLDHSLLNLSLLHPFEEVRRLNLSTGIDSDSFSFQGFFDDVEGYKSLRKLKHLEFLDLSSNAFRNNIFPFLKAATSLTTLNLRYNFMAFSIREQENITNSGLLFLHRGNGSIRELTHLKKLKALDLSSNGFASPMVLQDLRNLPNLEVVGLAKNFLDGPIEEVCEMKNLRELDLSGNQFVGEIPLCLGSLKMLRVLDLSSNHFSGNLPYIFSSLESIEYLSLLENNFTGLLSLNPLTNLTKLKVFKLSSTSDKVQVETDTNWHPKFQLSVAVLRFCSLEKIPSFLVYQKNLHLVDLSGNRLSGDIPTWLLANNTELKAFQFQNNLFTSFQMPTAVHNLQVLDFSTNRIGGMFPDNIGHAFPNLVHMNGSCNGFQGQFPSSMGELKNIVFLDLSYNNFNGKLPRSFLTGCVSLRNLKLSYNKFSGDFFPRGTNFPSLNVLRMDNNLFTGKIGVGLLSSTELFALDMSNNCLTGAIPSWISKLSGLDSLKVSNNFLGGTIPPAFLNLSALSFLDISGNLLSGALPSDFNAEILFLQNNNFTGPIPDTLGYGDIRIIDLRNNKLYGSIPQFVADDTDADSLGILLLSGNNLTGSIPRKLCDLNFIRLLDLSDNKLNGSIPSCLLNLSSRLEDGDIVYNTGAESQADLQLEFYKSTFLVEKLVVQYIYFQEIEVEFAMKQNYYSYFEGVNNDVNYSLKGILDYMFGMDLSNNELSGVIPAELGDLLELKAMNLSHNFLSSSIPLSFSNLKDIESLDLSFNMLHGSIPHQLTSLTSLEVFDVSHNNLSGIIPQGKQFNTFNESTYLGNPLLCGLPSNRSCVAKNSSEEANNGGEEEDDEAAIDMLIFYYSSASGYVTALIAIVVLMCFDCPWRRAWLRIVDAFIALAKIMLP